MEKPASILTNDQFDLLGALGGVRGLVESALPSLIFIILYLVHLPLAWAVGVPVACSLVAVAIRLISRIDITPALGGLIGIAISAIWALKSGQAENFFVLGIAINAVYGAIFLLSLLVRYPLIGVLVSLLTSSWEWKKNPEHQRIYAKITWLWVGMYALRLAVQVPLYILHAAAALAVVKLILGPFLFAFVLYLSWQSYRAIAHTNTDASNTDDPNIDENNPNIEVPTN